MTYMKAIKNINKLNQGTDIRCKHHIIPKSQGGPDDPENIVKVTPQLHMYLHCLYDKENKTRTATFFLRVLHKKLSEIKSIEDCKEYNDHYASTLELKREGASEAQKRYWADPNKRAYRVQQYSEAKIGKPNICKGTIWIHNDAGERKRISETTIPEGWYKGVRHVNQKTM